MDVASDAAVTALDLATRIGGTRSEDIRRTLAELVTSGELPPGTRLPTVRDMASALETSVGSVADAWTELRRLGFIDTRRRGGTTVSSREPGPAGARGSLELGLTRRHRIDYGGAGGDPAFLPELAGVLVDALETTAANEQKRAETVTPALRAAILPTLPFAAAEVTAAPGTHAAMHVTLSALIAPGDAVAVEDPTCVRNLGLLRDIGAHVVTVVSDAEGPIPASVAAALDQQPTLLTFQPVAAVPIGSTLTPRRRDELAALLAGISSPPWILEEDPAGPLGAAIGPDGTRPAGVSLGAAFPDRTIRVVHLTRAYGSVLQTAIIAGAPTALWAITERQRQTGARANPLLQDALASLLASVSVDRLVDRGAETYRRRNSALLDALAERGITAQGAGGFFAWIPVADERDALLTLAEHGISASPGSRSSFDTAGPHVRIGTTRLPDDPVGIAELADAIAVAASHSLAAEEE